MDLAHYFNAGYPAILIRSPEEIRVQDLVRAAAAAADRRLLVWTNTAGLVDPASGKSNGKKMPNEFLDWLCDSTENTDLVVLAKDFHLFTGPNANVLIIRRLKDAIVVNKEKSSTLVICGVGCQLPPELEKEITVIDLPLPDQPQLKTVLDGIISQNSLPPLDPAAENDILRSALGLTFHEAENAFSLSAVSHGGKFVPSVISAMKAQAIRKTGLLEMQTPPGDLSAIGGLEHVKDWLVKRRDNFSAEAAAAGVPVPKGMLLFGLPGTGKSLTAKVTAKVFGDIPLLRCDVGAIYGSHVGESERNMRTVIQTAEAVAPSVLLLDEIDKGFSGSGSSGKTDGGTGARVFATVLQWMNDKVSQVFVIGTANHPQLLDPAILRKGRWDEIFFVDLPTPAELESIWRIHLAKRGRDVAAFDLPRLVAASDQYTGAEIETVLADAIIEAFADGRRPLHTDDIVDALGRTYPVSKLMAEEIASMRKWAEGRARPASAAPKTTAALLQPGRKIARNHAA